ncbi:L-aspartate oxidase [Halalkalibacter sp. APA_J-10(15)]|uniref:L-aspartate oxidase n=1 Tax=Halalkalibacter sp. APA_J-10(15) TaxID=2933805 RepID=UPI001FF4AD20|nr:L-aspartate oxidase [Halalkalibacter sp. APA_J-10(15)]MCK0471136.1 L-aspartate oxidase [Halalkalibacter sp. APA_J-10(15)]
MVDRTADVIIIGSGVAGLMTAHLLADELNVMIITKSNVEISNSSWAQGGMAASLGKDDTWQQHYADTLRAGLNHHDEQHVEHLVKHAPTIVKQLQKLGVTFDHNESELVLGMEGAHQRRRIVHANGDQTGKALTHALIHAVKGRVQIEEQTHVYSLLKKKERVIGVQTNKGAIFAKATVLATGGLGQIYSYSSNVREATGDGYAIAYRAGATLKDMEFIQFHPTLFIHNDQSQGLVSEAVRGEGGRLINQAGEFIMAHHPERELAPRDVVSRAIYRMIEQGENVYLDCRSIANIKVRFPGLAKRAGKVGVDLTTTPIQVAPGAHFCSGGVEVDLYGKTTVAGLYAVGEVACTGVHGANRLASNSLLEGFVFAQKLSEAVKEEVQTVKLVSILISRNHRQVSDQLPEKEEIQQKMMKHAGIERTAIGLLTLKNWLDRFKEKFLEVGYEDEERIERKNMLLTASLIVHAALQRTESRGGHYRSDFPNQKDYWLKRYVKHDLNENKKRETHVI